MEAAYSFYYSGQGTESNYYVLEKHIFTTRSTNAKLKGVEPVLAKRRPQICIENAERKKNLLCFWPRFDKI
jgi:hypothetical protein